MTDLRLSQRYCWRLQPSVLLHWGKYLPAEREKPTKRFFAGCKNKRARCTLSTFLLDLRRVKIDLSRPEIKRNTFYIKSVAQNVKRTWQVARLESQSDCFLVTFRTQSNKVTCEAQHCVASFSKAKGSYSLVVAFIKTLIDTNISWAGHCGKHDLTSS
jgi:hypothetical protein